MVGPIMLTNQAMPRSTVIPELAYADVEQACAWLCAAFGFTLRWRAGGHRAQLNVGDGAMVVTEGGPPPDTAGHAVMVRVEDAHRHHERAKQHGARILREPTDFPYGERQYTAIDLGGHVWTFSQSIADVDPRSWGAAVGTL
jgi:uncharacterized glyoxalase superfamily protein PhnB